MNLAADLKELERLFPCIREYQALADRHGIGDIFQDNGGKLLQMLLLLGLNCLEGREGNDATDAEGNEYELKSVNLKLTASFSTHHHLNPIILKKYREVKAWYFGIYLGIELQVVYRMTPDQLEGFFSYQEQRWHDSGGKDRNNPKIPVKLVMQVGQIVYEAPVPSDVLDRMREAMRAKAERLARSAERARAKAEKLARRASRDLPKKPEDR